MALSRSALPALACAALLAGCAAPAQPESNPGPSVEEHWEMLEETSRLPAVGERWYSRPVDEVLPNSDYGSLLPFAGAAYTLIYPGDVGDSYPSYLYGLMTLEGAVVLDPVCASIRQASWTDRQLETHRLPVWELTRGLPEGGSPAGELTALSALDGSWSTPFRYWGAAASPLGILAGDGETLYLLDSDTGAEKALWSWEELGVTQPENFPWFTGDAYTTAHWTGEAFFLGIWGEDGDTALLLEPLSGQVTSLPAQRWYDQESSFYSSQEDWWEVQAGDGGTVTVSKDGVTCSTFPSPLPEALYPYAMDGRVFFQDYDHRRLAVTTLDGQTVLPAQPGSLTTLETEGAVLLAVQGAEGGDWQLYDLDGTPLALLPGGADSRCQANGPLVEVLSPDCSAYYWPDTGECVFRAWLTLEDHGETEASLS